jgi:hypothetical protein
MQIVNRMGNRYTLVIMPTAAAGPGVPVPFTIDGFLATFSPDQRRQVVTALAANPRFTFLDPSLTRTSPTDPKVLETLKTLLTSRRIAIVDPRSQPTTKPRTGAESGTSSGGGKEADPSVGPMAIAPPQCELMSAMVSCSHKGRKANALGLLEVVPGKDDDRIKLESQILGGCGKHPRWEIRSPDGVEEKTGTSAGFTAKMWGFKSLGIFEVVPRSYHLYVDCCGGRSRTFEVRAYPIDEWAVNVNVDFTKPPTQWTFEVEVTPWEDVGLKVKSNILSALKDKKEQLDWVLEKTLKPLLGRNLEWEFCKTKLSFKGKWAESEKDHRAFYQLECSLVLDPLVKGTFTVPFGPTAAIPPWIKRWTDYVGDMYLYLKIEGEVGLKGSWAKESPDEWKATASGTGKIGVKVGGNLFLMKKGALNLDINGGSSITALVKAPVERKPAVSFDLTWAGIEVEITIEAAWGIVEHKHKWRPVEGGSFFKAPKLWHPLGEAAHE